MSLFEEDILSIISDQNFYEESLNDETLIKKLESKKAAKVHAKHGEDLPKDNPRVQPKCSILTRWGEYCPNVKILDYQLSMLRFQAIQDSTDTGLTIATKTIRVDDISCITRLNFIGEDRRNSRFSFDIYENIDDEFDEDDLDG